MTKECVCANGSSLLDAVNFSELAVAAYELGEISEAITELLWDCGDENWKKRCAMVVSIANSSQLSARYLTEKIEELEVLSRRVEPEL